MIICDSQVHSPDRPRTGRVGGIDSAELLRQMDAAGVDRCVLVPLEAPGDQSLNNPASLDAARVHPDRFAVMGRFDFAQPAKAHLLYKWKEQPGMLGVRLTFVREPNVSLLAKDELDWFWSAAEEAEVPLMILAPEMLEKVERVAHRHPRLRLVVDHLNLIPFRIYDDILPAIQPLLALAERANLAVKASCLPSATAEPFPFPSLHAPIRRLIETFGARRVFWGSDLTRLTCPYAECVKLFSEALHVGAADKEWILGRGVMEWLGWDA